MDSLNDSFACNAGVFLKLSLERRCTLKASRTNYEKKIVTGLCKSERTGIKVLDIVGTQYLGSMNNPTSRNSLKLTCPLTLRSPMVDLTRCMVNTGGSLLIRHV